MKLDKRSYFLRRQVIRCIKATRRGHIGSAMSLIEILRVLYDDILKFKSKNPNWNERDYFILSKGHGCLALYSILADKGFFHESHLDTTCTPNSILGGHPESYKIPGVEASTGSLGHGLPIAVGIAIANKVKKKKNRIYVLIGDGELNEGSNWEAMMSASKHNLDNLTIIMDYNKIQSYGKTKDVLNLEPVRDKIKSFNLNVTEVDGHNIKNLKKKFILLKKSNKTNFLICHTTKGKGISFAENNPFWHHKNNIDDNTFNKINLELRKL